MLFFAIFTLGYFGGVLTALAVFPPRVKEIQEQEIDALGPVLDIEDEAPLANASGIFSTRFVGAKSAEAENSSHSSASLRFRFSAKVDKAFSKNSGAKVKATSFGLPVSIRLTDS